MREGLYASADMSEGVRLNLFRSEEALSRRYGGKVSLRLAKLRVCFLVWTAKKLICDVGDYMWGHTRRDARES